MPNVISTPSIEHTSSKPVRMLLKFTFFFQGGEVQSCTPTPAPLDEPLSFVIRSRDDLKSDGNEPPESAEDAESEAGEFRTKRFLVASKILAQRLSSEQCKWLFFYLDSISNEVLDLSHNVDGDMSSASSAGQLLFDRSKFFSRASSVEE